MKTNPNTGLQYLQEEREKPAKITNGTKRTPEPFARWKELQHGADDEVDRQAESIIKGTAYSAIDDRRKPQRDPSHTTSKLPCVRADEASPSPPLSRSTTRIQNETPSLVSKKASIHHSTTKKLRIKPYQNNNQRREPETTITRLHRHDDDRSTSRDPPQTNPKKATPSRRGPHQLVETPVRNHLPPDLFPLEVDLGFRRAQTHQSFKHIDG
ncbi:hypothetical protein Bca4012_053349 [Brassica carinata]